MLWKREEDARERVMNERRSSLRKEAVTLYRSFLKHMWSEARPGGEEVALLKAIRTSLGINENDHGVMERAVRQELYTEAIRQMIEGGDKTVDDPNATQQLRTSLGISIDQHFSIVEGLRRQSPTA